MPSKTCDSHEIILVPSSPQVMPSPAAIAPAGAVGVGFQVFRDHLPTPYLSLYQGPDSPVRVRSSFFPFLNSHCYIYTRGRTIVSGPNIYSSRSTFSFLLSCLLILLVLLLALIYIRPQVHLQTLSPHFRSRWQL